jgi:hypothetical protein
MSVDEQMAASNPTHEAIAEIQQWARMMAERGRYPDNTARFRASALGKFVEVLGDEEPRDAGYLLANIEDIGRRWALRTDANPDTAKTYIGRVRGLLEDFLAWKQDPLSFKGRARAAGAPKPEQKPKSKADEATKESASTDAASREEQANRKVANRRSYPLRDGREFLFTPPPDMTVRDVARITLHLLTLAEDFDPTQPAHARMFALVKTDPRNGEGE